MERSAVISEDGRYRYRLERRWGPGERVCWIMLNPSTADAEIEDPTLRRCIAFSQAWGYGGLLVVNLYPVRSPHPTDARNWARYAQGSYAPMAHENLRHVRFATADAAMTVAAWGAGALRDDERRMSMRLGFSGTTLHHLGLTKAGHPRHPLYVRGDTQPSAVWR